MHFHNADLGIYIMYLSVKAKNFISRKNTVKGVWEGSVCRSEQLGLIIMCMLFLKLRMCLMADQWQFLIYKHYMN